MKLEFRLMKIQEGTLWHKTLVEDPKKLNEFIVVGEEDEDYYSVQQLDNNGLALIGGLSIMDSSLLVPKDAIVSSCEGPGYESVELDVPKEYLTLDIIEDIQKLNS